MNARFLNSYVVKMRVAETGKIRSVIVQIDVDDTCVIGMSAMLRYLANKGMGNDYIVSITPFNGEIFTFDPSERN